MKKYCSHSAASGGRPRGLIIIFALLLVGCESSRQSPPLTPDQATALSLRLANDKADAVFHHRPFQENQPAELVAGRWVWTSGCGVGLLDYQAHVELAANGSTNNVDVQVLDDNLNPMPSRHQPILVRPNQPASVP